MSTGSPIWEAWQALIKGGRGNLRRRPATSSKLTPSSTYQPTEARPSTPVTRAEPIRMCRKRPFATHARERPPARASRVSYPVSDSMSCKRPSETAWLDQDQTSLRDPAAYLCNRLEIRV